MTKMISKWNLLRVSLVLVCEGLCFGYGGHDSSTRGEGTASAAKAETVAGKGKSASPKTQPGVLHEALVLPVEIGRVDEALLSQLKDGRFWLLFGENKKMVGKFSEDRGRTWSETQELKTVDGRGIELAHDVPHHSLVCLKSGKLGLVYGGPLSRPGRDGTVCFRTSSDGGKTWSDLVFIDPLFAVSRNQSARVLRSGRILVPVMKWVSTTTGTDAEETGSHFPYSWVYYSDDEGKTWKRSLSELLIGLDEGKAGHYGAEEVVVEELKDGTVLLYGRTEFGRPYQSFSKDGGISWSPLQPVELASSYSPHTFARIPTTGDLLLVWNQASPKESVSGLQRHRLSTAISQDEGKTWKHFRNLESLDDRTRIEPPTGPPKVYRAIAEVQPADHRKYPRAPGFLRISYPTVVVTDDEVAIAYDYGQRYQSPLKKGHATKIKIVSVDWLYERE